MRGTISGIVYSAEASLSLCRHAFWRERAAHRDNAQAAECQNPDGGPHSLAGVQSHNVHVLHGRIGPCSICCVICTCTYTSLLFDFVFPGVKHCTASNYTTAPCDADHNASLVSGHVIPRALTVCKRLEASCEHLRSTSMLGRSILALATDKDCRRWNKTEGSCNVVRTGVPAST